MSESSTETTVTVDEQPKPETGPADVAALQNELEKWKAHARKSEDRAKENSGAAKELEKLRSSQLSDTERAVAEAKQAGRAEVLQETGRRLAAAEFRAAAASAGLDVGEVLDLVDTTRFITEDGEPDGKAITAAVEKFTALRGEPKPAVIPMDLGPRAAARPADNSPRGLISAGLAEKSHP